MRKMIQQKVKLDQAFAKAIAVGSPPADTSARDDGECRSNEMPSAPPERKMIDRCRNLNIADD